MNQWLVMGDMANLAGRFRIRRIAIVLVPEAGGSSEKQKENCGSG